LPKTIEDATNNIAQICMLQASGEMDLDTGNILINANKCIIDALQSTIIEARLAALEQARGITPPQATIGGLPPLPGTDIITHNSALIIDGNGHDPDKSPIVPHGDDASASALPQSDGPPSQEQDPEHGGPE
jgi:hypothetical protein